MILSSLYSRGQKHLEGNQNNRTIAFPSVQRQVVLSEERCVTESLGLGKDLIHTSFKCVPLRKLPCQRKPTRKAEDSARDLQRSRFIEGL